MQASPNRLDRRANAGTAGAIAALNIPQAYTPGDNMIGGGIGYHGGEVAFAIGASAALDNGHSILKAGGSFGENGGASVGAGFGWHF
jgi:autotransporter adhesin